MSKHSSNQTLGQRGEQSTTAFLKNDGFTILAQNYRKQCGEIDVIAQKNDLIVFVEVKTRSSSYFDISQVVNREKQKKIVKTAQNYIAEKNIYDSIIRFDIAVVKNDTVTYLENAFTDVES